MKHKINFLIIALCTVFLIQIAQGAVVYPDRNKEISTALNKCAAFYNANERLKAKSCYSSMISKFTTSKDVYAIPTMHYNLGLTLYNLKEYQKAKNEFVFVVNYNTTRNDLKQKAQEQITQINKHLDAVKTAQKADRGDYYTNLDRASRWSNPKNLRVFIKSKTGKEFLLRKAFTIWDEKLEPVHFLYVNTEQEADITASINDIMTVQENNAKNGDRVGVTYHSEKWYLNKKYFNKARILVSYQNVNKTPFTNTEILAISLHEIGHAIGILSHSNQKGDIMYQDTSSYKTISPSNRDVNTVRRIYKEF